MSAPSNDPASVASGSAPREMSAFAASNIGRIEETTSTLPVVRYDLNNFPSAWIWTR